MCDAETETRRSKQRLETFCRDVRAVTTTLSTSTWYRRRRSDTGSK